MRRGGLVVILMMCVGLVLMVACGGGGGGGLPKSPTDYQGPMQSAVIDSTTVLDYSSLPLELWKEIDEILFPADVPASGDTRIDGSRGGYLIWTWDTVYDVSETRFAYKYTETVDYYDFLDAGANWYGIMRGEGSSYWRDEYNETAQGWNGLYHWNVSSLVESTVSWAEETNGWITVRDDANISGNWSDRGDANYSWRDLADDRYWALFDTEYDVVYNDDLGTTTYTASGTYCWEGDVIYYDGCFDFIIDLSFNCEINPEDKILACPPNGTMSVSNIPDTSGTTIDASAAFAYDDTGFDYSLDVGKDGSVDYTGRVPYIE